eukprot:scaffold260934_cov32-Tisochrysis_lutea.AAC.1
MSFTRNMFRLRCRDYFLGFASFGWARARLAECARSVCMMWHHTMYSDRADDFNLLVNATLGLYAYRLPLCEHE